MPYKDIASGWINTDKNGKTYLAVVLKEDMKAGDKLFLRKNDYKNKDSQPDYRYSIKTDEEVAPAEAKEVKPTAPAKSVVDVVNDDIPF